MMAVWSEVMLLLPEILLFYDRAVAKRDCYICGGEIKENAVISGKAFIDTVGVNAPVIGGESHVYGEVRGNIYIKGDIFPWDILITTQKICSYMKMESGVLFLFLRN